LYLGLVAAAGLAQPSLPFDAVASPQPDEVAGLAEHCRHLADSGLLARVAIAVEPSLVGEVIPLLEESFAAGPGVEIDVVPATGLLGSWLVRGLADRGARVVCLVRDLVPDSNFYGNGSSARTVSVHGDVEDGRVVERVLAEYEIDAVFHLAAQTIVEHAQRDP